MSNKESNFNFWKDSEDFSWGEIKEGGGNF